MSVDSVYLNKSILLVNLPNLRKLENLNEIFLSKKKESNYNEQIITHNFKTESSQK